MPLLAGIMHGGGGGGGDTDTFQLSPPPSSRTQRLLIRQAGLCIVLQCECTNSGNGGHTGLDPGRELGGWVGG